ncbi:MAG TPA: hypothetical protein DCS09_00315 [Porphyromonadaceae bacterium]|nr:hypothetical protein [Porphyromonadaceae bacterium]
MKIAITGADGLLGTNLKPYLDFIPLTQKDFDVTNYKEVKEVMTRIKPDIVVHLAAISTALQAEADRSYAMKVNVEGTKNMVELSKKFVFLSTDYVFDGRKGMYKEDDKPNPQTFIGITKYLAEEEVKHHPNTTIIRTSFKEVPYRHDQVPGEMYSSADYVPIIAYLVSKAIQFPRLPPILHVATERKWLVDLARKTKPNIKIISLRDVVIPIPRDCSLDVSLFTSLCK